MFRCCCSACSARLEVLVEPWGWPHSSRRFNLDQILSRPHDRYRPLQGSNIPRRPDKQRTENNATRTCQKITTWQETQVAARTTGQTRGIACRIARWICRIPCEYCSGSRIVWRCRGNMYVYQVCVSAGNIICLSSLVLLLQIWPVASSRQPQMPTAEQRLEIDICECAFPKIPKKLSRCLFQHIIRGSHLKKTIW